MRLRIVPDEVVDLERVGQGYRLTLAGGRRQLLAVHLVGQQDLRTGVTENDVALFRRFFGDGNPRGVSRFPPGAPDDIGVVGL